MEIRTRGFRDQEHRSKVLHIDFHHLCSLFSFISYLLFHEYQFHIIFIFFSLILFIIFIWYSLWNNIPFYLIPRLSSPLLSSPLLSSPQLYCTPLLFLNFLIPYLSCRLFSSPLSFSYFLSSSFISSSHLSSYHLFYSLTGSSLFAAVYDVVFARQLGHILDLENMQIKEKRRVK